MHRLYFLIPDHTIAKRVVDELLLARVPEKQIHVIAKDENILQQHDIPEADLLHKSDLLPAIERGAALGGSIGLLGGLLAVSFPPAGLVLGGGAILIGPLAGASFGAVVAPMIGVSEPNAKLAEFEDAIEQGKLLMMVDVEDDAAESISECIRQQYPAVSIERSEPQVPPFP